MHLKILFSGVIRYIFPDSTNGREDRGMDENPKPSAPSDQHELIVLPPRSIPDDPPDDDGYVLTRVQRNRHEDELEHLERFGIPRR